MNAAALKLPVVALAVVLMPATAAMADDDWHFDLTPYIWIPDINVDLRYQSDLPPGGGTSASVEAGPNQLDGVFLLDVAARKGDWSLLGHVIYLGYTTDSKLTKVHGGDGDFVLVPRTVDFGTKTKIEATLLQAAVGHTLPSGPLGVATWFAGLRYLNLDGRVRWNFSEDITGSDFTFERSGEMDAGANYLDAIAGVRGRLQVGDGRWFASYYLDVGTGESELTWQANLGAGYAFDWGDILVGYRYLSYDEGSDEFLQGMQVDGPVIGVSFHL